MSEPLRSSSGPVAFHLGNMRIRASTARAALFRYIEG